MADSPDTGGALARWSGSNALQAIATYENEGARMAVNVVQLSFEGTFALQLYRVSYSVI